MEIFHYLIVAGIVSAIIIWQTFTFYQNKERINRLRYMFPHSNLGITTDELTGFSKIECQDTNDDFSATLKDINIYLEKNRNKTTDYHILKEIVNRNVEYVEEEVDTMLSAPLYLGLMATIAGVAIGVISFAWTDLSGLLSGSNFDISGIQTLLTDVGIAMTASFLGVLYTKVSTSDFKDARSVMSKNKNIFLTWIQTELMPNLTDDITGALIKMTNDLNKFNSTFANNTRELKETLSKVSENYKGQVKLLDAIERIKISKVAQANIEVYDKLQGCTNEIERLFEHLGKSEQYIQSVVSLNYQIGSIEERTRIFEEVGNYFKDEIEYVKDRQGLMRQQMSSLDSVLQEAMSNLGDSVGQSLTKLTEVFQRQNQSVQTLIEEQQNSLLESITLQRSIINQKIAEINDPFAGLQESFSEMSQHALKGIDSITNSFEQQNMAISQMLSNQREMLEKEIASQRSVMQDGMSSLPGQMASLPEVATSLKHLIALLTRQQMELTKQGDRVIDVPSMKVDPNDNKLTTYKKTIWDWIMIGGVCGSFILLFAILIIQLFGIRL